MKILTLLLLLAIQLTPSAFAGNEGPEGGDGVFCNRSQENNYKGKYFLDYIVAKENYTSVYDIDFGKDTEKEMKRIIVKMKSTYIKLGQQLEFFYNSYKKFMNKEKVRRPKYQWINAKNGVSNVADENLDFLPPENCLHSNKKGEIVFPQVIKYIKEKKKRVFKADRKFIDQFSKTEEQESWLIIHEFFRVKGVKNAKDLRRLNAYFHSNEFMNDHETEIERELDYIGAKFTKRLTSSFIQELHNRISSFKMFLKDAKRLGEYRKQWEKNETHKFVNHRFILYKMMDRLCALEIDRIGIPYPSMYKILSPWYQMLKDKGRFLSDEEWLKLWSEIYNYYKVAKVIKNIDKVELVKGIVMNEENKRAYDSYVAKFNKENEELLKLEKQFN